MVTFATLCYLRHGNKILLQRKAQGLFGEGRWNAPGGKMLAGELPEKAAAREMLEETGLKGVRLTQLGAYDAIPYREMWQDDRVWLPLLLDGKSLVGDFYFTEDYKEFISHEIHQTSFADIAASHTGRPRTR